MQRDDQAIPADARNMIETAADRAGMSISGWLNAVILDAAIEEGVRPVRYVFTEPSTRPAPEQPDIAAIYSRIDELASKIESLAESKVAHAPPHQVPEMTAAETRLTSRNTIFDRLAGVLQPSRPAMRQHPREQRRAASMR